MDNNYNEFQDEESFVTHSSEEKLDNIMEAAVDVDDINNHKFKKKKSNNGLFKYISITVVISLITSSLAAAITYHLVKNNLETNKIVSNVPANFAEDKESLTKSEIYDRISPAVVTVSTKSITNNGFYFQQEVEGIGSGFIINEDGYILTNYHVIQNAKEVSVILSDNSEVKAKVINYDANKDVAMLKIVDNIKVPGVVELGDSDSLKPGQEVIAIGTPMSKQFSQSTTSGIISAINRNVETSSGVQTNLLQTDAAINPGNSGGPLVNSLGQVIGINTLKVIGEETEGLGFAIPINEIKGDIEVLSKPILNLGIAVREVTEEMIKNKDLDMEEGLYVVRVDEFSSAERAGIQNGDLITHFDGKRIKTFEELQTLKNQKNEGDKVQVKVDRDGKNLTLEVVLKSQG